MSASPRDLVVASNAEPDAEGRLALVTPESAGWVHVGFEVLRLHRGRRLERPTAGREVCAVLLSGRADISFGGVQWPDVGGRESVFEGLPHSCYAPPGGTLGVAAVTATVEVALCWAPARRGAAPALIAPTDVTVSTRGGGDTERTIRDILMESRPAESLLVTEVLTPAGHWSSFPPHKHDTDDLPREARLEETYYHRMRRPGGGAVQLAYTDDRSLDAAVHVRDGDVVLVPRGYHPVGAEPGCDLYYLNVMAGPVRRWQVTIDPAYR
ncbi:MAG: 5-deoxy-glucuronate isomerase [Candidatus Dormibacteraeota bacterium]|nr:5-deoxy-glucuronate isomerase [Candidatus Dormibacteraeota bacterium]